MSGSPDRAQQGSSRLAGALVSGSIARPWIVIAACLVLSLLAGWVTVTRFAITTETDGLLTASNEWHRDKTAYAAAFPQLTKVILAVVDGRTPAEAEAAAARLVDTLGRTPGPSIRKVWRPDGGPFFDREGLLLLPTDDVRRTTARLNEQAPTLLALSGDPTLRGLLRLLQLGAGEPELQARTGLLNALSDTIDSVLRGGQPRLSWQDMMADGSSSSGGSSTPGGSRKFVLVDPILDYQAFEPGKAAATRIRAAAAQLDLTPENGVSVRLTGASPLADEEFATVQEGMPLHLGLTVVAIAFILFLALRSPRVIMAVLLTTFAGLLMTVGLGLVMVGRFNVISIAVAALFLGLGVDFGIQVAVRYRDERHKLHELCPSLVAMGHGIGWSLTLAALSLLAGFFAFLPTSFRGVSELGLITGVGMIIAFTLSLTLLPAIIAVAGPPEEAETVETPPLAAVDAWIHAHRRLVIGASTLLVVAGLPFLVRLDFDANPMHLRSEKTEAVSTFLDLSRQPGLSLYTLEVLAPSLDAAGDLAARLARLPEVARVVTLATFLPADQAAKLALIRETAKTYDGLIHPQPPAAPPTDAEFVPLLRRTASVIVDAAGSGSASDSFRRLAANLTRLADAAPPQRAAAATALTGDLPPLLRQIATALQPGPVTVGSLPESLRADWLAADGRARISVSPKGDSNDNEVLEAFTAAVRAVAPNVAGGPVDVVESHKIIVRAFATAGILAFVAVFAILTLALRKPKDVALTLGPLVIATILTLETAYLIGMPLNLANIIALPLMLAVGVNFHIYYMIAWRDGVVDLLASSLTRAIFFSSLTTGIAFGSLWLSNHPGTASMGKLLTLSLFFTLLAAFIVVPAFLGPPRQARAPAGDGA